MKIFESISDYNSQCVRLWSLWRSFSLNGSSCQGGFSPHITWKKYRITLTHYCCQLYILA